MKVCQSCKEQFSDDNVFCRNCGAPLAPAHATSPEVQAVRESFESRIVQQPQDAFLLVEYGDYLASVTLDDEALSQYFRALDLDPSLRAAREKAVKIHRRKQEWEHATAHLLILLEQWPDDAALW